MTKTLAAGHVAVPADTLREWAAQCLRAVQMPDDDARLLADSLVQTSLWGVDTHGIAKLPHYLERLSRGSIKPRPNMTVTRSGPCTAQLAADQGHGIVVAHRANGIAIEMAREHGVGAVGVSDSSHCGAIGLYTRVAAKRGLVGLAFTHADRVAETLCMAASARSSAPTRSRSPSRAKAASRCAWTWRPRRSRGTA